SSLAAGESLISRDGFWVGRHFLRVRRAGEAESGMLARGQDIERMTAERDDRQETLDALFERLEQLRATQLQLEEAREQHRRSEQEAARQQGELKAQLSARQARLEQVALRRRRLDEELSEA